jgi:hypothetical protein
VARYPVCVETAVLRNYTVSTKKAYIQTCTQFAALVDWWCAEQRLLIVKPRKGRSK